MCLKPTIIDQRVERLSALLHAARTVAAGNAELEAHKHAFAGVTSLIVEIEKDLGAFAAELKASCPQQNPPAQ